jgi:hypothetical protein
MQSSLQFGCRPLGLKWVGSRGLGPSSAFGQWPQLVLNARRRVEWARHQVAPRFRCWSACGSVSPPLRLSSNFSPLTIRSRRCARKYHPRAWRSPPIYCAQSGVLRCHVCLPQLLARPVPAPLIILSDWRAWCSELAASDLAANPTMFGQAAMMICRCVQQAYAAPASTRQPCR